MRRPCLEASFIVFRLRPWFAKIPKRLVKTPKIYFSETGLAARLLGLRTPEQVSRDPLRGHLFENLVVSDFVKESFNRDDADDLFFFRTSDGLEIDLVRDRPERLQPIEIKSSQTWSDSLAEGLSAFRKIFPDCIDPVLVYAGRNLPASSPSRAVNFLDAAAQI